MKKIFLFSFFAGTLMLNSCSNAQPGKTNLTATEFATKLQESGNSVILDVRSPEEFASGHLENATNIDWNGNDFENKTKVLNKEKPIFIYCLSGGRSAEAAQKLRASGFKEVYEMQGGIMKWRSAKLPESNDGSRVIAEGMSKESYNALLKSDKLILVDFYADWCGPCKKMKPFIDEISTEMKDKVQIVRINVDENKNLVSELGIESIPVLKLYKNEAIVWETNGFTDKKEIVSHLQ